MEDKLLESNSVFVLLIIIRFVDNFKQNTVLYGKKRYFLRFAHENLFCGI